MQSSHPQWLQNITNYILDNVFDILTIAAAGYIFVRHQFVPWNSEDIAVLATWIIALLGLIAVSGLWQQHRRLKILENLSQETRDLVFQRLSGPAHSQDFFWSDAKAVTTQDLGQADDIYIVGMVLNRAVRNHMDIFSDRLAAGANLRFILLDWQNTSLMDIMPNRSFGSHPKEWWQERIRQTEGYIEDIPTGFKKKGTLKVGYLPFFPSFGMWLIDPDKPYGQIHVEIYHHRTPETNPAFSLYAEKDAYWYGIFRRQFDLLWQSCEDKGRVVDLIESIIRA